METVELKVPKYILETIDYVWENRKKLSEVDYPNRFDMANYGDLDSKCYNQLSDSITDWIGDYLPFHGMTKKQVFRRIIGEYLRW
jgi:hypothetical protein